MSLIANYAPYKLQFKFEAKTSRETLRSKTTYFIKIKDSSAPDIEGWGECAMFPGLSYDDSPLFEQKLASVCRDINQIRLSDLKPWPSIAMGVETALLDLKNGGLHCPFPGDWSKGEMSIKINGLVWMGDKKTMLRRLNDKIDQGFKCIKIKIGGIDFNDELEIIKLIRTHFNSNALELRLDANGAFTPANALEKLQKLSIFDIHSIEQPIKPGQWDEMAKLVQASPIPIALDEELIGLIDSDIQTKMLQTIRPQYIILKPSLIGGFSAADLWITQATELGIGWWGTSALESNIGLNAIAQWVSTKNSGMPQGLGTGQLFTNNVQSPISICNDKISYDPCRHWELPELTWK